ncbi:hypothetical protein HUU61_18985 [Rhodopseudomonas palustris]|nr:hypothetical protein [Rhodopseudomonas palustris]
MRETWDGWIVASFATGVRTEWTGEWLGTTMFFGHSSEAETLSQLTEAQLRVRHSAIEKQDNVWGDI